MESPSCIQDEPFPHPLEPEPSAPAQPGATKPGDKRFRLWYVGGSCLDRRTTLPMLPWLMAEIRRRSQKPEAGGCGAPAAREVLLVLSAPFLRCVPAPGPGVGGGAGSGAVQTNTGVFIFEHKAQHISRFIHNSHDLTYFAYLIKAQPEDPESQMACHVFRATDPNQVSFGCQGRDWGRGDCQAGASLVRTVLDLAVGLRSTWRARVLPSFRFGIWEWERKLLVAGLASRPAGCPEQEEGK